MQKLQYVVYWLETSRYQISLTNKHVLQQHISIPMYLISSSLLSSQLHSKNISDRRSMRQQRCHYIVFLPYHSDAYAHTYTRLTRYRWVSSLTRHSLVDNILIALVLEQSPAARPALPTNIHWITH